MKLFKRVTAAALAAVMVIANANFVFGTEIEEETDEKIEEIIEENEIENEESLITEEISPDFSSSSSEIVASGFCGGDTSAAYNAASNAYKNLWWKLDSEGVLTIGGTGKMKNYSSTYDSIKDRVITGAPWGKYVDQLKTLVIEEDITSIGERAFYGCSGFTGGLVIPNSVTSIGERAFYGCSGFTGDLVIGNNVTSIGNYAFYRCSGFTGDLVIGNNVTSIGDWVFADCSGFTGNLVIPNSVTSIGDRAFEYCSGFTGDLVIPDSVTSIGGSAFSCCSGFTGDLVIPNSVTSIGEGAFRGCSGFNGELVIPDSVTSIGDWAFEYCSGFTGDLVIGNSVTSIGGSAFYGCYGFTGDLVIPNSVTSIGNSAFRDCVGFTGDLVIPNSVTSIGEWAFFNCSGFTGELVIPDSVTSIGECAFYDCSGFTGELVIGDSVKSIGDGAFNNTHIKNVYFKGNAPAISEVSSGYYPFETNTTLYYINGKSGWSSPEYHGYKTATWTPDYTVTFNANGGEGAPESQIKIVDTDLAISDIVPTRFGYNFKWWRGNNGFTYNPGDLYTANADLTLTAVWVRDETVDAPRIIVTNTKGMAGSIVNVEVRLKNNPGISSIATELIFDSSMLEYVGAQIGSGMAAVSGAQIYTDINRNGTVSLSWLNTKLKDFNGDYTFATVSFKIKDSAKVGDISTITVQYGDNNICNAAEQSVDFLTENGTVSVTAYTPGDIDGDGSVSNKDVMRLFKRVSKMNVDVVTAALDVNGDGKVNNNDVITLFQYVSLADVEIF